MRRFRLKWLIILQMFFIEAKKREIIGSFRFGKEKLDGRYTQLIAEFNQGAAICRALWRGELTAAGGPKAARTC
jgi:hypothetical protein